MAESSPSYVDAVFPHRRRNNRTMSECSDVSTSSETHGDKLTFDRQLSLGAESLASAQASAMVTPSSTSPAASQQQRSSTPEVLLYDKYLSKFFNPLHAVPYADHSPQADRQKGVLYDVDGKFGYITYSERQGSYHPMIDIRKYTRKEGQE